MNKDVGPEYIPQTLFSDSPNYVSHDEATYGDVLPLADIQFSSGNEKNSEYEDGYLAMYVPTEEELNAAESEEADEVSEELDEDAEDLERPERITLLEVIKNGYGFYPENNNEFNDALAILDIKKGKGRTLVHLNEVYEHQLTLKKQAQELLRNLPISLDEIKRIESVFTDPESTQEDMEKAAELLDGFSITSEQIEHAQAISEIDPVAAIRSIVRSYEGYANKASKDRSNAIELRKLIKSSSANNQQKFKNFPDNKNWFEEPGIRRGLMILAQHTEIRDYAAEVGDDVLYKKNLIATSPNKEERIKAALDEASKSMLMSIADNTIEELTKKFDFWVDRIGESTLHYHVRLQGKQALESLGVE